MDKFWVTIIFSAMLLLIAGCRNLPDSGGITVVPPHDPTAAATATTTPGVPQVSILSPPAGASTPAGEQLLVQAQVYDDIGVTHIELWVNGALILRDETPDSEPQTHYELIQAWTPEEAGEYILEVIALRADGLASEPARLVVQVVAAAETGQETELSELAENCTVMARTRLNVRQGPGAGYPLAGGLNAGDLVLALGKSEDGAWWQIDYDGLPGWIAEEFTLNNGRCHDIAVVAAPPPPAGSRAATRTPTQAPQQRDPGQANTPTQPAYTPTYTSTSRPEFTHTPPGYPAPGQVATQPVSLPTNTPGPANAPSPTQTPVQGYAPTATHTLQPDAPAVAATGTPAPSDPTEGTSEP